MAKQGESAPLLRHATHTGETNRADLRPQQDREEEDDRLRERRSKGWRRWSDPVVLFVGVVLVVSVGFKSTSRTVDDLQHQQQQHQQLQQQVVDGADGHSNKQAQSSVATGGVDGYPATKPVSAASDARGRKQQHLEQQQQQQPGEENATAQTAQGTKGGKREGGWRSNSNAAAPGVSGEVGGVRGKGSGETKTSTKKPNVFFFLLDDLGYGDIGYQSSDLGEMTPNLDALAAGGIKLTNYYSMSICTPARASLMTGRYPIRYGMQYNVIVPGSPWGLPTNEKWVFDYSIDLDTFKIRHRQPMTRILQPPNANPNPPTMGSWPRRGMTPVPHDREVLPQYMNDAGYESHMVGKWHLGSHSEESLPNRRGFKTYMGYLNGEDTYYTHKNIEAVLDDKMFYDFGFGNETAYYDITKNNGGVPCSDRRTGRGREELFSQEPAEGCFTGLYSTDAFVGRARQVVESKSPDDEEPLFLYVAHQSVHAPTGPAPTDDFTDAENEALETVAMRTKSGARSQFAGVLMYLDKRLGAFMDDLEDRGWLENSIIVVASDNGGCPGDGGSNYPLRGVKQSVFEGGTKVPAFVWSKSHIPEDLWGTTYDNIMHVTDWLPTLTSAAGGDVHGSAGDVDGVDHWSSLTTKDDKEQGTASEGPRSEMLYNWDPYLLWSQDELTEKLDRPQGAFRDGNWKLLVNVYCSGYYSHDLAISSSDPLLIPENTCPNTCQCQDCIDLCQLYTEYHVADHLYNLESDPREEHDLIDAYPEIAARLRSRAEEVAFSEWTSSNFVTVNEDSYQVWKANDWWMVPWMDKLSPGISL